MKKNSSQVNIKYLQAFVITAETGSFSSAARAMGKAQSVVSNAISNFEIDLDTLLFSRENRYPELTEAGKMLLPEAQAILKRCSFFESTALSLKENVESQVTIAIDEHIGVERFPVLLREFSAQFPLVQLNFIHPARDAIIESVQNGEAHLAIIKRTNSAYNNLDSIQLSKDPLDILVHQDHALTKEQNIDLEKLAMHRQVVLSRPSERDSNPQIISSQIWFADNVFDAANIIYSGCCWGILPNFIFSHSIQNTKLVRLNLTDSNTVNETITDMVWHKNIKLGPAAIWWREQLAK